MTDPGPDTRFRSDLPEAARGSGGGRFPPADLIAIVLTVLWLAFIGLAVLGFGNPFAGTGLLGAAMVVVAALLPVALIWFAAMTVRSARAIRDEARALHATVDAMKSAIQAQPAPGYRQPAPVRQPEAEPPPAFTTRRTGPATPAQAQAVDVDQPSLALGTPAEVLTAPLPVADLVRALNFPDSTTDKEGFRALRQALEDRVAAKLVRAAQDVLKLLGQDGIYMDDLVPDRARPETWRRFAEGERGRTIAGLGGVRDRSSLALTAARMRSDTIFRDAAHHFLRQFDRAFSEFAKGATDQEIADLAATRTARAFMLLGRVTGTFD
jgi:hypothetical protein